MFNRSWYKNTWLGKKLGLKIDWNTENLVCGSTVIHSYDEDNEVYLGFKLTKHVTHECNNRFIEKTMEVNIYLSEFELSQNKYNIVYDPTKIEAQLRIKKLEEKLADEEASFIVSPDWNLYYSDEKQKDFRLNQNFLDKAGSLIIRIEDYKSCNGKVLNKTIVCKRGNLDTIKYLYQTNR